MQLDFVKLNGLGNDFVFFDNLAGDIELTEDDVIRICDRHFGVGADGVILVERSTSPDCDGYMHYINADGTLAQMCGNGVRCFAKYLVDNDIVDGTRGELTADTLAGPKRITFTLDNGVLDRATVDMGAPILDPVDVPVDTEPNATTEEGIPFLKEYEIPSPWGPFAFTTVSMGNPHAICFIEDWSALADELFTDPRNKDLHSLDIDKIGSFYESHPLFPEKTNVEFAEIVPDGIDMRVYERGCGETLACGTGACATNVAAALTGRAPRTNRIHLLGGDLDIQWSEAGPILMSGPAAESFTGTWNL